MGRPCRCCEDPVVSSSSSSVSSISSSSVSSISSSSVSVECECGNTCSWTWSGSDWTKTEDNCVWDPEDCGDPVPCECYKPGISTPDPAVTYITSCIAESDCCSGGCVWMWTDEILGYFDWFLDDDSCAGTENPGCDAIDPSTGETWANCQCIAPTEAGTEPLQELSTNCRPADCGTCAYESVTDGERWTWQLSSTSCTGDCSCDSKYSDALGTAAEGRTGNANCFDQTW